MKILYIITQGENGGAQKNVLDLSLAASEIHSVTIATGRQDSEKDNWLHSEFLKNNSESKQIHTFQNLIRNISLATDIKGFFEIYNFIKKNEFDLVHLHSTKAGILGSVAGRLAGAKVIYTVHGFVFQEQMHIFKKAFYIFAELISSFFIQHHICVAEKDVNLGQKMFILRNKAKYTLIYNGINSNTNNLLQRDIARNYILDKSQINISEEIILFGSIANLYSAKGLEYYIQAVKILKEKTDKKFLCIIFGEGELRPKLEALIGEYNLQNNFKLLGATTCAVQYLSGLDVFVMSSIKEGLPYALVEATLPELPIIATSVGGIPEIAKLSNIQLIESKDREQLSDLMLKMLDRDFRVSHKSHFNTEFDIQNMITKILQVYEANFSLQNL